MLLLQQEVPRLGCPQDPVEELVQVELKNVNVKINNNNNNNNKNDYDVNKTHIIIITPLYEYFITHLNKNQVLQLAMS